MPPTRGWRKDGTQPTLRAQGSTPGRPPIASPTAAPGSIQPPTFPEGTPGGLALGQSSSFELSSKSAPKKPPLMLPGAGALPRLLSVHCAPNSQINTCSLGSTGLTPVGLPRAQPRTWASCQWVGSRLRSPRGPEPSPRGDFPCHPDGVQKGVWMGTEVGCKITNVTSQ